jgi:hypothetical protein
MRKDACVFARNSCVCQDLTVAPVKSYGVLQHNWGLISHLSQCDEGDWRIGRVGVTLIGKLLNRQELGYGTDDRIADARDT